MERVVDVATITKLTRNSLLIIVVPIMSYYYLNKIADRNKDNENTQPKWYKLIPLFVLGFIAMAIVRTLGDSGVVNNGLAFGFLDPNQWASVWTSLNTLGSKYLLGIAMAGVGLSTSFGVFKGIGIKPFYIGMVAAVSVTVISIIMSFLLGNLISF